ncbi:MAG TPA: RIP metalloprotease RseP [Woeseiaceae bacterium]|nr:RIP metalloprotease RseP [Woeseiaceae bacterium]
MSDVVSSTAAFIVAISVLVAIHEFGHYLVGRLCGMKVLRFSIGFGKPLWTRIAGRDRTEYCISAIPLGGYVKFLDEREGPVPAADRGRAFNHRPVWARMAVLFAGPAFNFLFAAVAYWALFVNGVPTVKPAVGDVAPQSYAAAAGFEYGDRIVRVADREAVDWETVLVTMLDRLVSEGRVSVTLESEDGWQRTTALDVGEDAAQLTEPGKLFDGLGFQPWQPPAVIAAVTDGGAAARAGLEAGDRITAIAGESVHNFGDLVGIVTARPGELVSIDYRRDGREYRTEATLAAVEQDGTRIGRLEVTVDNRAGDYWYERRYGPLAAIPQSLGQTWEQSAFTVRMLGRMLTGDVSVRNISGPINIAQYAGQSASAGLNAFLKFLALVSVSLGVLNLLPIPVLDGGQIVYQAIELVKGSPLSERSQLVGQQVGIFALLLLMSFAFYNDIARILS